MNEEQRLLKVEEVSCMIGVSYKTLQNWYAWKRQNPEHELAKLLPDVIQKGSRGQRFWRQEDIWKLIEFRRKRPAGCKGVMGEITQKYTRKED